MARFWNCANNFLSIRNSECKRDHVVITAGYVLMHCPFCSHPETKVIDSRLTGEGRQVRRRRECLLCNERYTTFETAELVMPRLIKRDRAREPFDEVKLRNGMVRALEQRPVNAEAIEESITRIIHAMQTLDEREVESRLLGKLVMDELRELDEVAYVRFASVYRRFQDVTEFQDEIRRLQDKADEDCQRDQMSLLSDDGKS